MVGWAALAPRSELPFARSTKIPHVDDLPVWSIWCIRVRPGHRGRGIARTVLAGAADYVAEQGAPAEVTERSEAAIGLLMRRAL